MGQVWYEITSYLSAVLFFTGWMRIRQETYWMDLHLWGTQNERSDFGSRSVSK